MRYFYYYDAKSAHLDWHRTVISKKKLKVMKQSIFRTTPWNLFAQAQKFGISLKKGFLGVRIPWLEHYINFRDLTIILIKYQYTYQVSVYLPSISILIIILLFWFSNTDTDTSYFKNVLKYWYFSIGFLISISIFLFIFKEFVTINTPILASSWL